MAWIESHQTLGQHPKTLALAAELGCSLPTAVGHLQYLWWWALDYAQDGLVTARTRPIAIRACQVQRQPDRFWDALVDAGFVDLLDDARTDLAHPRLARIRRPTHRSTPQRRGTQTDRARREPKYVHRKSGGREPDIRCPSTSTQPNQPDRTQPTGPDRYFSVSGRRI